MSYQIQDIIVASLNDEPVEVERVFNELMESRIAESILARKRQLAGNLVAESTDEPDEDDDDTEFDDTDFDDVDDEEIDLDEIDLEDIDFDDIEGFDEDDD